jgi:hypothetical protein
MTKTTLVSSPSLDSSPRHFGEFERHTRGIGYNILSQMGYDRKWIGKRSQGILSPIVIAHRAKHEGLGFYGRV